MAWEERQRGGSYYYRSVRDGGRVRKEYVGAGLIGELAARLDQAEREKMDAERDRQRYELERLEALAGPVLELDTAARVLARAHLVAGGYHRHKGEWRMRRDANSSGA